MQSVLYRLKFHTHLWKKWSHARLGEAQGPTRIDKNVEQKCKKPPIYMGIKDNFLADV